MTRVHFSLAVAGLLGLGSIVHGQFPGLPGNQGYSDKPGIVPTLPYGPPAGPYMAPAGPPVQPVPKMPYAAPSAPTPAPVGEPYLVKPEKLPTKGTAVPQDLPQIPGSELPGPNGVRGTFNRFVEFFAPDSPNEPYTTYEGRRYLAEVRQDNSSWWVQASFVQSWIRPDQTPPLVTTGGAGGGVLGNPDTVVLLGNGSIGAQEFSGARATVGFWLDPERIRALELTGVWLGRKGESYRFASDGGPASSQLTSPLFITNPPPGEGGFFFATPGLLAGAVNVSNNVNFHGAEANISRNLMRLNGWSADVLYGVRYVYLNESLNIDYEVTPLVAGLDVAGVPQPAGGLIQVNNSFDVTNRFYGGQVGGRVGWTGCHFDAALTGKIAFGTTHTIASIDGSTTTSLGASTPGGIYAQPSNMGSHSTTIFAVVPEVTLTAGFEIVSGVRVFAEYNFLFWSRLQRAGDQVDRNLDLTQTPLSGLFAPGAVGTAPTYSANRTDFWVHGINVGLELKY